jgi:putative chitinase
MAAINRAILFDGLRHGPFPSRMTAEQVGGIDELLDIWESDEFRPQHRDNNYWLADILAQIMRETGARMVPVREGFAKSDKAARAYVKRQGYKYAKVENGQVYYGRGRIQNTWGYNYKKLAARWLVDLYNNPDLILQDGHLDAKITIAGFIEGTWTGKKLADYFPPRQKIPDWKNARRIVNGLDHWQEIAANAKMIYADLVTATKG